MSDSYRILFLGDVVGKPGRRAVQELLPSLQEAYSPLFTIVNGENSAGGVGITADIAEELFQAGADALTLGNHAFHKRDIAPYLDQGRPIIRPGNMPPGTPGCGKTSLNRGGIQLDVFNFCGRVYMEPYDDPFRWIDEELASSTTPHRFLDFHAEATSEKIAMGWYVAARVTALVGTHTHVTTADEQILPGGTAYITDVGMCGPQDSVLGMDKEIILQRFLTQMPQRFEVANSIGSIRGVIIDVRKEDGRAWSIQRIAMEAS
ncbi:MAG TPA: TIGR00282 family metallophosphoesterase [Fimbriimonadaceae bacterium]|nr:TIGR00282 family metallophosphoesterase [Fimbriimonadaceae bacterium]HRJ33118.1 TIGR00282 family metallophosphoesterase [Fimbriimonadaceae bacterium]